MPPEANIGNVYIGFKVKGLEALQAAISGLNKIVNNTKKSFDNLTKSLSPPPLDKLNDSLDTLNQGFKEWDDSLRKSRDRLSVLKDNSIVSWFDNVIDRVVKFAKEQKVLETVGGVWGLLGTKVRELWSVLGKAFGPSTFGRVFGLLKIFTKMYWIFGLITSALMVFKSIWQYNIGGVQTLWIAFVGKIMKKWAEFQVKLRTVLIKLEPLFKAVLIPLFKFISAVIEGFLDGFLEILDVIGTLVDAFKPILTVLDKTFKISSAVNNSFGGWGKVLGRLLAYTTVFFVIFKGIMMIYGALKMVWAFLTFMTATNPILLIIAGIALAAYLIIKHWKKVKGFFMTLFGWLKKGFSEVAEFIGNVFGPIIKLYAAMFEPLKKAFKNVVEFIVNLFKPVIDFVINPIKSLMNMFRSIKGLVTGNKPGELVKTSPSKTTNINNQPNVTIYTSGINEGNAMRIGQSLVQGLSTYTQNG